MKATTVLALLGFLLLVGLPLSTASDDSRTTSASARINLSADDFDWRNMIQPLATAALLPGEQAIKAVLENSRVLRVYEGNEIRGECRTSLPSCAIIVDRAALNEEVTRRIDQIVQEGLLHRHKSAVVDYQLAHGPFPFSEVAAVKEEKKPEAYFMLAFSDHRYTAAQLQAKYGPPFDTNIFQWYSAFKYRADNPHYRSDAVFEVDPTDGAVLKVAISIKMKKTKEHK